MSETFLKFRVIFKNKNINLKLFFKEQYIFSKYDDLLPKQVIQDQIYQEQIFEVIVSIPLNSENIGQFLGKMCKDWCSWNNKFCKSPYSWLLPVSRELLQSKKPFHQTVETREFAFGTLPEMDCFMQHYSYESDTDINCSFYHNKKLFSLFLSIHHDDDCNKDKLCQKFNVRYDSICRVLIYDPQKKSVEILFQLYYPPFVYVERKNVGNNKVGHSMNLNTDDTFAKIPSEQKFQEQKWERTLNFGCQCKRSYYSVDGIGKTLTLKIVLSSSYKAHNIVERLIQRCSKNVEFCYTPIKTVLPRNVLKKIKLFSFLSPNVSLSVERNNQLFSCQYAWEAVVSASREVFDQLILMYINEMSFSIDHCSFLQDDLKTFAERNSQALTDALFHISEMISKQTIFTFISALKKLFHHYCKSKQKIDLPPGMCFVRRTVITPSRVILLPSVESFDNRVIRELPYGTEYMLRVLIQDDNFSKLTFAVQYNSKKETIMKKVVGDVLKHGLCIGNRLYEVLASSNSQLREHGLWLYSKDANGKTATDIKNWMGDFSSIKNVAKYMARMGQCFSTSDVAIQVTLLEENVFSIDDIKTEDGKYTFSDGIGMISKEVAIEIQKAKEELFDCNNSISLYAPSAYQIRYKGCKGMVCENPCLSGRKLIYRPSMEKFKCEKSNKLEIVKISAPRAVFLNRQLITILEQLGIKSEVFGKLQREMIFDLTDSLIYEEKAAQMLSHYSSLNIQFHKVQKAGILVTEEPFFRSLLIAIYKNAVDKLRTKARIAVPHEFGRNMLGVLDETGTLQYGEIFVQYSEQLGCNSSKTSILTGTVVVTKNPCMHPGDVRKLKAVDVDGLHHIKDCIVFPSNGPRPHPDEMAGSDLDGDEYVVIWAKELIFPNDNYPPMNYPVVQEQKTLNEIGVKEMIRFLCEYIQNDNIGPFANAHLAWADQLLDGIFSQKCLDIAAKYPYALDFAKTGEKAVLAKEEKTEYYPDFMEKSSINKSYRSKRTLGSLYRFVRNLEVCVTKTDFSIYEVKYDPILEYPGWKKYKESAENMYFSYKEQVTLILKKYGIKYEVEALSGFIENVSNYNRNSREMENAITIIKSYIMHTMAKYRLLFLREVENETQKKQLSKEEVIERRYQRASAWYMVSYCTHQDSRILSFPWILSDVLIDIYKENMGEELSRNEKKSVKNVAGSSLLWSLDKSLSSLFFHSCNSDESCACITITRSIVHDWVTSSYLSLSVCESKQCFKCFDRIFTHFLVHAAIKCCSWSDDYCSCAIICSPSVLIMKFLKFYISNITYLGKCEGNCNGFQDINLQTLALQTYISLAISRNYKCLGFSFWKLASEYYDHNSIQEGDPILISVTGELKNLIENHMDEIKTILIEKAGVIDIQISVESEKGENDCMLVSSTGTSSQRWHLEELMIDSRLSNALQMRLTQHHSIT